jgi:acyl transferase domain-containing protein/NAD(P)-dependent dehydrogenase (short-subunit alcohol dehydrogenase family)
VKQDEKDRSLTTGGAPLAIIGIGCLFPKSEDKTAYWTTIREGVDAITEIPESHWRITDYFDQDPKSPDRTYGKRGGFLSEVPFNPMQFNIPPNAIEAIDTSQLLGLIAAGQALKDAGYGPDQEYDRSKVSVILGVTGALEMVIPLGARLGHPRWREALKDAGVSPEVAEDVVQRIADSYVGWQENSFPGLLGNVVAGRISKQYDLGGTNCVVDAACASSFSALHLAGMELTTGAADLVVTGGVDTFNDIFMYTCFSKTPALSASGNAKPFDSSADGTILGEGLGLVVLKRLADAERDNDRIYAVIRGVGSSSDGKGEAIYTPSASGQKKAILTACANARVTPDSIGLLEAHGTGTKVGDAVEAAAAREIYGESDRPWCAISSIKAQIGHAKAAAGAAGLIKAALALHHRVIPPTIKVTKPLDEVSAGRTPFYITTRKRPWITRNAAPRRAAVSAFGFGGSNFHTILEEYRPLQEVADWDGSVQILTFSGPDATALETQLATITPDISWNKLRDTAASLRASFDANAPCRLALVVERTTTALAGLLATVQTMLRKQPASSWATLDGACYAVGATPGKLALLFPGQGAQYTGMLRDLACTFPQFISVLEQAEAGNTTALSDLIYPPTAFSPDVAEQQETALRATEVAQPAIGAVSLGALRLLESFGLRADATAGHSYGELTALCAAGLLDEVSFHNLSRLRGSLMAAGNGDTGSMLAVSAPLAAVEQMLAEEKIDLVIANRNAPTQAVLSGASSEIARAITACKNRKLSCKQLTVAAAFHSPLVADAAAPFLTALADIRLGTAQIPVYANSTAAPYPADTAAAKELLAGQLARPVEFVAQIEAMYAAGLRTFVEAGPGARLSGLVKAILGDREHTTVAIDSSNGKRSGMMDLARCLTQLSVLGHSINLSLWDEGHQPAAPTNAKKPALTVPLCGANYVKPKPKRPPTPPAQTNALPVTAAVSQPGLAASVAAIQTTPAAGVSRDALAESLRVTREGMSVLQRMQEETAQLHRRFLEGQETASRTIQILLSQQHQILQGGTIQTASFAPLATAAGAPPVTLPAAVATPVVQHPPAQPITTPQPQPEVAADTAITSTLMAVISEKTGYPVEMLEPGMSMDADLGIDSIKRVEILSALQERLPASPAIGPDQLGTLNTLGQIADYLGAGATATPVVPQSSATDYSPAAAPASSVPEAVLNRSTIKPVSLTAPADPIPLATQGVIAVTDDGSSFSSELCSRLTAAGHGVILTKVLDVLELLPLDKLAGLVIIAPAEGTDDNFLKNAFMLLKQAAPALKRAAQEGGALLATISRLDGSFGCGADTLISDPLSGGLAGLTKTARHEWPGVICKAIDLGSFPDHATAASSVAAELFLSGPIEVGLSLNSRIGLSLTDLAPLPAPATARLQQGQPVVVTGGGRGVTATAAIALAKAWQPLLVLLGRSPQPLDEPAWMIPLTDESAIKRAIMEHATEKLHPKDIEERYQTTIAGREMRETITRIEAVGGTAIYRSVDIRDSQAVDLVLSAIRNEHGPIRGLVHGAGVLADRLITDKTREQFNQVYSTKVSGLRSLLAGLKGDDLSFIALFGSTTGRMGRSGQVDYAVANEVLNKLAQVESRRRPDCHTVCINWGPWDGGMVTPALKKVFAHEGISLIPLEAGGDLLVREIASDGPVEITALAGISAASLAISSTKPAVPLKEALALTLSVNDFPFIRSHVIDGKAVLPMAMVVEWLAHAALHGNPGLRFHGFNDLRICKGIIIDQNTPCSLQLLAGKAERQDSLYLVPVELVALQQDGRKLLHARAEMVLANRLPEGIRSIKDLPATPYQQNGSGIYDQPWLFHGPDLHGIEQIGSCSEKGISALVKAAPQPSSWIQQPMRSSWLTDPLVVDSAFQLMILWSFDRFGAGSLPSFAGRYRQFQESFPRDGAQVVIRVTNEQNHSATADMEFLDRSSGKLIARLEGYECVIDASLERAFQRNQLLQPGSVALEAA